jgi:hypothetical protein
MLTFSIGFLSSGLAVATGWDGDPVILVFGIVVTVGSGWSCYTSWRSGVFVSEEGVIERGMFGTSTRVSWTDVAEVEIGPGPSLLPSRTVVLVGKDGINDVGLGSMSWYSFRSWRVPRRVAEFQKIASLLMKAN